MASVGKHIRQLRLARKLTQEQLAEQLFVTRQTVSAWETGKALPDLETLERIAAALGAEVTEVIYGTAQSLNLRRVKRRWALAGGGLVLLLAVLYFLLVRSGVTGTWKHGLRYQFWNQNYSVATEVLPDSYSVELDLNNLAANEGRVLYADETGCRITVDSVEQHGEDYRVVFRADGVCSPGGGQLVSGCYDNRSGKQSYSVERSASMTTSVGGETYGPCYYYLQSSMDQNSNQFGFYLFPLELYENGELSILEEVAAQDGIVTVTVSGLTRLATDRLPYISSFAM